MNSSAPSPAAAAAPPYTVSSGEGEKKSINPELWQACAGPLVSLPAAGTHVVYFPQGHSEQVAASMKKDADAQIPNYPNLGTKLLCQLHNVTLHADPETDEVYAQMTLQPVPSFDKEDLLRSDLSLKVSKPQPEFFCKTLTASDTSTHGGFSVPRRAAEKIFPTLDFSMQPPAQELTAKDLHDNFWTFRHIYRGQPKRHLLTTGWSLFVSGKRLFAGDSVLFVRDQNQNLLVGLRRASRQPTNLSSSVLSSDSMHIGILAAAAHAAANNSPFTVFYNPRASPSEFITPLAKYYRAVCGQQISVGMRFRMLFETEESGTRRYMGTITGISDLDPVRWKNSQWRNFQVGWDESIAGERRTRVSAWEIEPVTAPFFICPPYFRAKHPRDSDVDASDFENVFKRTMPWLGDDIYMKDSQAFNGLSLAQRMTMLQNASLVNSVQANFLDSSPGFSLQTLPNADTSRQIGFAAPQIAQQNNLQFDLPRQIQQAQLLDQLQRSYVLPHQLGSVFQQQQPLPDTPQKRQNQINQSLTPGHAQDTLQNASSLQNSQLQKNIGQIPSQQQQLVNQSLASGQAHSHILQSPTIVQPQNTIPKTPSLQNSHLQRSMNQIPAQKQTVFGDSWQNSLIGSQLPKQFNQLTQAQLELQTLEQRQHSLLLQQSSFQQQSESNQLQNSQKPNVHQSFCSSLAPSEVREMHQSQPQILAHQISGNDGDDNINFSKLPQLSQIQQQPSSLISELQCHVGSNSNSITRQPSIAGGCTFTNSAAIAQSPVTDNFLPCSTLPSPSNIPNAVQTVMSTGPQSNNVGDRVGPSSSIPMNANGLETMASEGNLFKDFHQKPGKPSIVDVSNPESRELFGQYSYQNVPRSQLDYLDTSSATSASLSQSDVHLKQNNSSSFNSQTMLLSHMSNGVEVQGEPGNENIHSQHATTMDLSNISSGGLLTSYENCKDAQQDLSSSMVTQSFGVQDMAFNSIDSAMNESHLLNHNTWATPPQYQRIRTYTKVYKRGAVGRCIDVTRYSGYEELKQDLARRFGIEGQLEDRGRIGWKLVYVDHENDVLLVGDDPWEEFVRCVRCIKILSPQEVQQMSLDGEYGNLSLPNQTCSSSDGGKV